MDYYCPKFQSIQCGTLIYMAPQILFRANYTKSIDIWSCSIIMYMLYSEGKHPIYKQKMTADQYKNQLTKNFKRKLLENQLAENFYQRISKIQPLQRYNANQALRHPWITQNPDDPIPLSIHQSFKSFEYSQKIHQIIVLTLITDYKFRTQSPSVYENDYLKKCEQYNIRSRTQKTKQDVNKKIKLKQMASAQRIKELFGEYQPISRPLEKIHIQKKYTNIPKIEKLNDIFATLFQKKSAHIQKIQHTKQYEDINNKKVQNQTTNKQFIQKLINQSVKEYKEKQVHKNRRIFSRKTLRNQKSKANITIDRLSCSKNIKNAKSETSDPHASINQQTDKFVLQKRNKTTIKIKEVKVINNKQKKPPLMPQSQKK